MLRTNERIPRFLCAVMLLIILACTLVAVIRDGNWVYVVQAAMTASALFVPFLFEIGHRLHMPPATKVIMLLFLFSGLFVGSVNEVYYAVSWWDSSLHFLSGAGVGLIAYSIALKARRKPDGSEGTSHFLTLLLIFCFIMTIGTLWEIVEFSLDRFVGMHMQRADTEGLFDTMSDILLNTAGALLFTVAAHFGLKGRVPVLDRLALRAGDYRTRERDKLRKADMKITAEVTTDLPD